MALLTAGDTDMRQITETFFAAGQISPADVATLKAHGIALVINNRPDMEEPGQPTAADIETAVHAAGLAYVFIPVHSGGIDPAAIEPTRQALASATGHVLAFCRSGARSTALWAMARAASGAAPASLLQAAANAGYDLSPLEPVLHHLMPV
jgi:uncharacterized protein (TIGR01244 family)